MAFRNIKYNGTKKYFEAIGNVWITANIEIYAGGLENKMACKLYCTKCKMTLKEEGDESKTAPGEYRVYSNKWNCKNDADTFRVLRCLNCGSFNYVTEIDEEN
jgi:hypothetical protein